jgi:RimJ/RimL family protein N-acetyltransferase
MEEEEEFIRQSWQQAENGVGYFFAIVEKVSNEMVGSVTLSLINSINSSAELGIWISEESQRLGFGEEAVRMVLNFGFEELKLNSIKASVIDFNDKSRSLFQKVGMKESGKEREAIMRNNAYHNIIWFDMLRKEFKE